MNAEDRVLALVEPIAGEFQLEVVDVVYAGGRVKVTLDQPGGIGTDLLARATRRISKELDVTDPISGSYTLEVSSPGLERVLRKPLHYERSMGEQVSLKLVAGAHDPRRVSGQLVGVDAEGITIDSDGVTRAFRFEDISKARTVFDWSTPSKGQKGSAKSAKTKRGSSANPKGDADEKRKVEMQ